MPKPTSMQWQRSSVLVTIMVQWWAKNEHVDIIRKILLQKCKNLIHIKAILIPKFDVFVKDYKNSKIAKKSNINYKALNNLNIVVTSYT